MFSLIFAFSLMFGPTPHVSIGVLAPPHHVAGGHVSIGVTHGVPQRHP